MSFFGLNAHVTTLPEDHAIVSIFSIIQIYLYSPIDLSQDDQITQLNCMEGFENDNSILELFLGEIFSHTIDT